MECPNCSKEISDSAKICGYCGHRLKAPPAKCPDCGKDVREGAKVCGYCGHKFKVAAPTQNLSEDASVATQETESEASEAIQEVQDEIIPEATSKTEPVPEAEAKPKSDISTLSIIESNETEDMSREPITEAPQPTPVEKTKDQPSPVQKTVQSQGEKKRKFPVWAWALISVIVLGLVGSMFYFIPNRLPKPVTEILPDAEIVTTENFDSKESENYYSEHAYVNNGIAKIEGNGNFLENYIIMNESLGVGEGVLVLFKIEPEKNEEWWIINLYTEKYNNYYASVGFSEWYHPFTDILGEGYDTSFRGVRTAPKHDEWYYALFAITDTYVIKVRIWQKNDPSQLSEHTWQLESELRRKHWIPAFFAHNGNMYLDSVKLISFPVE